MGGAGARPGRRRFGQAPGEPRRRARAHLRRRWSASASGAPHVLLDRGSEAACEEGQPRPYLKRRSARRGGRSSVRPTDDAIRPRGRGSSVRRRRVGRSQEPDGRSPAVSPGAAHVGPGSGDRTTAGWPSVRRSAHGSPRAHNRVDRRRPPVVPGDRASRARERRLRRGRHRERRGDGGRRGARARARHPAARRRAAGHRRVRCRPAPARGWFGDGDRPRIQPRGLGLRLPGGRVRRPGVRHEGRALRRCDPRARRRTSQPDILDRP